MLLILLITIIAYIGIAYFLAVLGYIIAEKYYPNQYASQDIVVFVSLFWPAAIPVFLIYNLAMFLHREAMDQAYNYLNKSSHSCSRSSHDCDSGSE